jgi:hypothetical protein
MALETSHFFVTDGTERTDSDWAQGDTYNDTDCTGSTDSKSATDWA